VKSDPSGRELINANPTSDATIKMSLDAGQPWSLDHLNQMLDGADQAAQIAYDNARGLGLGDQAAHDISGKAWNRFLRENTAALGREPTGSGLGTDSTQPGPGGAGGLGPTGTQVMNPPNAPPCPAPPCGPSQSPNAKTGAGFSQLADTLPQIKR